MGAMANVLEYYFDLFKPDRINIIALHMALCWFFDEEYLAYERIN